MPITIRETTPDDIKHIYRVQAEAFGYDKEAILTESMLNDPTAEPCLSLMAFQDQTPVGHILFTACTMKDVDKSLSILAPLAVVPEAQNQGIGGELIKAGLLLLAKRGTDIVFVLGHPLYYPKLGFTPVHRGIEAPYPIPEEHADAWMAQTLASMDLNSIQGQLVCCDTLNQPEHWRE